MTSRSDPGPHQRLPADPRRRGQGVLSTCCRTRSATRRRSPSRCCASATPLTGFSADPRCGRARARATSGCCEDGTRFLLIIMRIATFFAPLRVFMPLSQPRSSGLGLTVVRLHLLRQVRRFTNMGLLAVHAVLGDLRSGADLRAGRRPAPAAHRRGPPRMTDGAKILAFGAWDRGPLATPEPTAHVRRPCAAPVATVVECSLRSCRSPGRRSRSLLKQPAGPWPALRVVASTGSRKRSAATASRPRRSEAESARRPGPRARIPAYLVVRWVRERVATVRWSSTCSSRPTTPRSARPEATSAPTALFARFVRRLDRLRLCRGRSCVCVDTRGERGVRRVPDRGRGSTAGRFAVSDPVADPDGGSGLRACVGPRDGERLEVLFFGTGVPLHGLDHAARRRWPPLST